MNFSPYTTKDIEEIFQEFATSPQDGLSEKEATKRLRKYGSNKVLLSETHWWQILLRQFKSSFIYLLLGAMLISFLMQAVTDASMILLFVLINVFFSFYQEYHSSQALKFLKKYTIPKAKVLRNGKLLFLETSKIVPGDIVLAEVGSIIPADLRFFQEQNLTIDESVLTGESAPVRKVASSLTKPATEIYQAQNIGFSGTVVTSGKGMGVVIATGRATALGEISKLTIEVSQESSFEKNLKKFSLFILRLTIVTLVFVFLGNFLIKGKNANIPNLFIFSIALAVSAIPEALPVVTSFSLSRGALRLAKNKVVVKRLSAIEDLGSIDVLASDKTGTLTENKLTVAKVYPCTNADPIFYESLAASSFKVTSKPQDAFDDALLQSLSSSQTKALAERKKIDEIPFDPERRLSSVLLEKDENYEVIVRGAAEVIANYSTNLSAEAQESLSRFLQKEGEKGRRTLGVAKKEIKKKGLYGVATEKENLVFLGAISFVDPIKKTAKEALQKAEKLGVKVKILTGDSKEVAGAVACEIGLLPESKEVLTGEELKKLESKEKRKAVEKYLVFARVSPQQKYEIINILQENHEVAFLGEGINDAPALKIANVSLVVRDASDVAREVADIVLLEKSLSVIVNGIKEGREVFANTIKYIKATLSSNFGNFYAIALVSLFIPFLPMLPLQILLVNLLSDFPMIAVATDNVDTRELKKPKTYDVKEIALFATILGLVSTIFDFILFGFFYQNKPEVLQTAWFMSSILTELAFIFLVRTRLFFLEAKKPSLILVFLTLTAATATIFLPFTRLGQGLFQFTSLPAANLFLIFTVVIVYLFVSEIIKLSFYRYSHTNP